MFAYIITSRDYYGNLGHSDMVRFATIMANAKKNMNIFNDTHKDSLLGAIDIRYAALRYDNAMRSKGLLDTEEWNLIRTFLKICLDLNIMPIINFTHYKLEIFHSLLERGNIVGLHFKDSEILDIKKAHEILGGIDSKPPIFYSAHSVEKIYKAISLKADYVTYSPIFCDKHGNRALGIKALGNLENDIKRKVIALGGITQDSRVLDISKCGIGGFASISYFHRI